MGAYILFRLKNPEKSVKVNNWVDSQKEQKKLREIERPIWIWDKRDVKIEKEKGNGVPNWLDVGEGNYKMSGWSRKNAEEYRPFVTQLLEKLHKKFGIEVYSGSCALKTSYFSKEEIRRITNNGRNLTGDEKDRIRRLIL